MADHAVAGRRACHWRPHGSPALVFSLVSTCLAAAGDQVVNGKPAPEIFLRAAREFSPPAPSAECLVFEDAVTGVAAGKAAGM